MKKAESMIEIQQYRSAIRVPHKQKRILEALGLRRIGSVRLLLDCPSIRGMVECLPHLVRIVEGPHEIK